MSAVHRLTVRPGEAPRRIDVLCPGATSACESWWPCESCRLMLEDVGDVLEAAIPDNPKALDLLDDALSDQLRDIAIERITLHGQAHNWGDEGPEVPSGRCGIAESAAGCDVTEFDLPADLPAGSYQVTASIDSYDSLALTLVDQ